LVYYKTLLRGVASHYGLSLEVPYKDLPHDFKTLLMRGSGETAIAFHFWRAGKMSTVTRPFEGVIRNLERLYQESESEFTKNLLKGFMNPQFCDVCRGQRLKPEVLAVTLGGPKANLAFPSLTRNGRPFPGLSIMDVCQLSVEQADAFFAS